MRTCITIFALLALAAVLPACTPRDQQKEGASKSDSEAKEPAPKPGSPCRIFFKADALIDGGTADGSGSKAFRRGDSLDGKLLEVTTDWVELEVPAAGPKGYNRLWLAKDSVLVIQDKE